MIGEQKFIMALDEGTTSARAIVWDHESRIKGHAAYEITQIYPKPGWVEHNPDEIWNAQVKALKDALKTANSQAHQIEAIGVTNQRETTIIWNKRTGRPVHNAIVWQCRRTAQIVDNLKENYMDMIKQKTGLIPDSYFSGPKIKWLIDNVSGLRQKCEKGDAVFGNIDTFLIWQLTGGKSYVTDYTNASRTMMFNIHKLDWDDEILEILKIPREMLPEPRPSSDKDIYGYTKPSIFGAEVQICGDAGDQQAALFGQTCFLPGMTKCTYGTGNFILANTGDKVVPSKHGLLTTVAYGLERNKACYALEGSIFITGAAVQWLRDGIKVISSPSETESMAMSVPNTEGVYFVPAFVGLGAPYWDQYSRGLIIGITRGTTREHIARATLEAIAYQTRDIVDSIETDMSASIGSLRADGGAAKNNFLMQFQADILGKEIVRPSVLETTALGAGYLAGLAVNYWKDTNEISKLWKVDEVFKPQLESVRREKLYEGWTRAVKKAFGWSLTLEELGLNY